MRISTLFISTVVAFSIFPAGAQLTRLDGAASSSTPAAENLSLYGPKITAVKKSHLNQEKTEENSLLRLNNSIRTPMPRIKNATPRNAVPKAASKASDIYGFRTYTNGYGDCGWMKVTFPTPSLLWKRVESLQADGGGFVRNNQVYNFYYVKTDGYLTDAGILISDFKTGATIGGTAFDIFSADPLKNLVYTAVYDEANDVAYVITSDSSGKGWILQKFDPKTLTFTDLNVDVPSDWLAFAWHPGEGTFYMLDESCVLKRYDMANKKFVKTGSFSYDITGYLSAMVYSPKDNAFLALLDAYKSADSYDEVTDVVLVTETGKATYVTTTTDNDQWSILYCTDAYQNPSGPKAPVLSAANISGEATSGSFDITLPTSLENGSAISGTIYLTTLLDGNQLGNDVSGNPGAKINIPVSTTAGLHRLTFTPYVLSDNGKEFGTSLIVSRFFGHDTPAAPANVKLTSSKVTWDAVKTGANNGYINPDNVTYEVSIDGVKITPSPVKETTFTVSEMPKTGAVGHIASVVAIENGKSSEAGLSGKYYSDDALSVPCYLGPDPGQSDMDEDLIDMFTVVRGPFTDGANLRGWRYDDQSEHTGGFYCLYATQTVDPEKSDEWLFLPAINFDSTETVYRFTMDVWCGNHYFSGDEDYEVTLTQAPNKRNPVVIKEQTTVFNKPEFETSETLFRVPSAGEWYIGIHYLTNPQNKKIYRLYARHFKVETTDATLSAPGPVTDLEAEASARGQLSAIVTFKMPTVDIMNSALKDGVTITATVSTGAGSVKTTGTPGQSCSVTVPAAQGDNTVQVITSSDQGTGKLAETTVYVGVYRPGTPVVDAIVSADNATVTLDIDIEDYNESDQWAGGAACDALIYRKVGNEWRQVENIGTNRSWSFSINPNDAMDLYQFAVAAQNPAGYSEVMNTVGVVLGKVYNLPMNENFIAGSNKGALNYEPIITENISYLGATWGFDDPANWYELAENESGTALIGMWESVAQLRLPKFSTSGLYNVKADLSLFFGDKSAKKIYVYASSPSINMEPLATYSPTDGNGWEHKIVNLPAACQNQAWVEIIIRCEIEGYSTYFMMDSYSIANYPDNMITITGKNGDTRATVGDKKTFTVEVTNTGTKDVELPAYTCSANNTPLTAVNAPASIPTGKAVTLSFEFTPKVADLGEGVFKFTLPKQESDAAVVNVEHQFTVYPALLPVIDDLAGAATETQVILSWSEPYYTETFETFEPWDYSEKLREFTNLDIDGKKVWTVGEFVFPGRGTAKGFQVFNSEITDNPIVASHSGTQCLLAMSTTSGETNDWLISPEVNGGSKVSFWMNILHEDYPETIYVMYSSTGTATSDFKQVNGGYICPAEFGWAQYTVTLPADAKYFALWHYGDDGNEQFGCLIDDLTYEPANPKIVRESFNIYRDGNLVASNVTATSYVDNYAITGPTRYYVTTVGNVNGEKAESEKSNVIWVSEIGDAGIDGISDASASIYSRDGKIVFSGFYAGEKAYVFSADGKIISSVRISSGENEVSVSPGIYVAKCGSRLAKVVVR